MWVLSILTILVTMYLHHSQLQYLPCCAIQIADSTCLDVQFKYPFEHSPSIPCTDRFVIEFLNNGSFNPLSASAIDSHICAQLLVFSFALNGFCTLTSFISATSCCSDHSIGRLHEKKKIEATVKYRY